MTSLRVGTSAGRWVLLATVLGSGMAAIDSTVVGIALPTIGRQFHASLGSLQWVVTGYALALASLLIVGGSLGDQFGRRRVFLIGVIWFTVASAACSVATGVPMLVGTRVLQGVGAALLTPGSLAIIQASFRPDDRGRAIGSWSGLGGVATAAGPLLGGYLIAAASWRLIFLINVPLGLLVLLASLRHVPESSDPSATHHVDVTGAALILLALLGVTYGLIAGPTSGFTSPLVLGSLVVGVLAGASFVLVERSASAPMLPLEVFTVRQFSVTNVVTFIVYGALGGALFLLPVQLQIVDGYSPLESGVALLPLTLIMLIFSARSGRLATRIGPRLQMGLGPVVVGLGLALLARTASDGTYLTGVLPAVLVFGAGLAITVAPLTSTALGAISGEHAGLASAVNNSVARIGGLLAVAVLPGLAGITGTSYLHPATFDAGFRTAVLISGAACAAGGLVGALWIVNPPRAAEGDDDADGRGGDDESRSFHHCALDSVPLVDETP